jgi:hypothetical protein
MADKFRQSKWGEQIDAADSHIRYLEQVRRHHADRPNFRADELNQAREVAALLRRRMKELGKRRSSAFWPNALEGAA